MDARMEAAIEKAFEALGIIPTPADEIPKNKNRLRYQGLPGEIAEQTGRHVTVALGIYGSREMAYGAIDRAFKLFAEEGEPVTEMTNVSKVFPIRIASFLTRNGIHTILELTCFDRETLCSIEGGNCFKTVDAISDQLEKYGFELRRQ